MSISSPSYEIYVIDVPQVKDFAATYFYNFFVPDESVNETGGVPTNILARPGSEVNTAFIQYSITRAPRFVQFNFDLPKLADIGNAVSEQAQRTNSFKTTGVHYDTLILNNLDKIINEENFASSNYVSVHFNDGQIDDKVYQLISGSMVQATLQAEADPNVSLYKAAQRLVPLLPTSISPTFIIKGLTQTQLQGITYRMPASAASTTSTSPTTPTSVKPGLLPINVSTAVFDSYYQKLKKVGINTQINAGLMQDLVNKAITDPTSTQSSDLVTLQGYSKQTKQATNQKFSSSVSEQDYKSFVPYVSVHSDSTSAHAQKYSSELVGFVIDKFESLPDGTTKAHPPIVVGSPYASTTADYQVKFNASYTYCVRTIALLTLPAIDDDTGDVGTIKVLVSSKPSNKITVSTLKLDAPPPPSDVDFVWNYETGKLQVNWAWPMTSERDIKQFQVFKRRHVNECFQLQKVYNFDDSVVPFPSGETPDPRLVEYLTSPATYWVDDDFQQNVNFTRDKGAIYAVAAIDAHGLTSTYSAQFRVWFDRFQNKLQLELVSHSGAPKPYPNLYLDGDVFQDTINVAGPHSLNMKLYFNPEYYYLYDDQNNLTRVLQTEQTGGSYVLQFMNLDVMKSQTLTISIDDQLNYQGASTLSQPVIKFGPQRPNQASGT